MVRDEIDGVPPAELEHLYRQLRSSLEASKAAPTAADFYYGEMEARRAQRSWSHEAEWWLLSLYKWIGGYGVRAFPPFAWYVATVCSIGVLFWQFRDDLVDIAAAPVDDGWWAATTFALDNSVSLLRATDAGIAPSGVALLVVGRIAAVALLAMGVFALRSRVER